MSHSVRYTKCQSSQDAYDVVKKNITPEVVGQFNVKASFDYDESRKIIKAKGTGFELKMSFSEENLDFDLDLGFLLKPLRSTITSKIEHLLAKVV